MIQTGKDNDLENLYFDMQDPLILSPLFGKMFYKADQSNKHFDPNNIQVLFCCVNTTL